VELLPGERRRDRVLTHAEEREYFRAAQVIGEDIENAYRSASEGIRAMRGQQPIKPGRSVSVCAISVRCSSIAASGPKKRSGSAGMKCGTVLCTSRTATPSTHVAEFH
jgi:hypothetical protein